MHKSLINVPTILLLLTALTWVPASSVAQETPTNDKAQSSLKDIAKLYKKLATPQTTQTGNKIEVLEFFWYGCPHCYRFEPIIEKWLAKKADYIEFIRVPGVLGENWINHAKAFYTAEKLGVIDAIHGPLFDALNQQKRKIIDDKSLRKFFIERDVSGKDFDQTYHSQDIEASLRKAYLMGQRYQLTGVPAMIINGKYTTSASIAGSLNKVIEVVNILAADEYQQSQQ